MNILVQIQGQVQWKCFRASSNWIGICDPLKLTVQGETWTELMEGIGDTLDAVLNDLMRSNELPDFLRSQGWQLAVPLPLQPPAHVRFDVPFVPAMMEAHGSQADLHQ